MLFLIMFKTSLPTKRAGQARFKEAGGANPPEGTQLVASYHYADGSGGALIIDTNDAVVLTGWANGWADVVEMDIRPVVSGEQMGQLLAKTA
jgi:Protein of unknown function (DUF3303)